MNHRWTIYLFLSLLASPTNAGLFKRPNIDPLPISKELTKKVDPYDEKKVPEPGPMIAPNPPKPTVKKELTAEPTRTQVVPDTLEVQRKTNQVRVTLINVGDISGLSPGETMFFEDCFIAAFVESQNNGDGNDVNVRSMIVLLDESLKKKKSRLRGSDRSLWAAPGGYFDVAALFEWSCRLCSGSSSSSSSSRTESSSIAAADDDSKDDDFYFNGGKGQRRPAPPPKSRPTPPPKSRPTPPPRSRPTISKRSVLDDDFTHADDDSLNAHNKYDTETLDDTFFGTESFGVPNATASPTNDSDHGTDMADDDVFSDFFGKRILEESDERRFEELLCNKLRGGPFQAFHRIRDCFVVFIA